MKLNYKSYSIEYDYIYSNHPNTIILLHGWGGDKNSFAFLLPYLKNYNLLTMSFPPYFLKPNYQDSILPIDMNDYLQILITICKLHNIMEATIICHSFGFRITLLLLSTNFKINAIIATGGAGINTYKNITKKLTLNGKIIWNKKLKLSPKNLDINLLKNTDKKTFKNIIGHDLTNYKNLIKCPLFLFWGKRDKSTPTRQAKIIKKSTPNTTLKIVDGDHFAYLTHQQLFINSTLNFLKEHL